MTFVLPKKPTHPTRQEREEGEREEEEKEKAKDPTTPPILYEKPQWSALPRKRCHFEVLKGGLIMETFNIPEGKEYITCGRLPTCDLSMEHASVSRFHAIIQFSKDGIAYVYDLDSSHGTFLNKQRIPRRQYIPLEVGSLLRFGESTRLYIFDGDEGQEEREIDIEKATMSREFTAVEEQDRNFNYIRKLSEWCRECGIPLLFERIEEEGDGERGEVRRQVRIPAEVCGQEEDLVLSATGSTRKEAEMAVARVIWHELIYLGVAMGESEGGDSWAEWKRLKEEELQNEADLFFDRTLASAKSKRTDDHASDDDDEGEEDNEDGRGASGEKRKRKKRAETIESLLIKQRNLNDRLMVLREKEGQEVRVSKKKDDQEEDELDAFMENIKRACEIEEREKAQSEQRTIQDELARVEHLLKIAGYEGEKGAIVPPIGTRMNRSPIRKVAMMDPPNPSPRSTQPMTSKSVDLVEDEVEEWQEEKNQQRDQEGGITFDTNDNLKKKYGY